MKENEEMTAAARSLFSFIISCNFHGKGKISITSGFENIEEIIFNHSCNRYLPAPVGASSSRSEFTAAQNRDRAAGNSFLRKRSCPRSSIAELKIISF